ncbi:MAG: GH25 family lysozyme [Bythopirellula sp.]|nr:GH25 family lysozyme [Bythopirellula sp.]
MTAARAYGWAFSCVLALACCSSGLVEKAAAQTRSLGIDISAWQGNLTQATWNTFAGAGNRDFVFLRSSRGGTTGYYNQSNASNTNPPGQNTFSQRYDDPYFVQNITRATTAGMFAGAYHFGRMDIIASTLNADGIPNNGTDEADHFIQMAGPWMRPGYLLPIFDHEAGISQRTPDELAQFAIDFSNRIYQQMRIRPGIYIGGNYNNDLETASQALQNEITAIYTTTWNPRWPNQNNPDAINVQTGHPKDSLSYIYGPWDDSGTTHPWSFWQYASTGQVPGYSGSLDVNVAQGGVEFLKDKLVPAVWMNDSSGDWSSLANWNSGQTPIAPVQGPGQVARVGTLTMPTPRLPGAAGSGVTSGQHDTVILDRPNANITVTLSSGTHDIRKLYAREALNITGGSLNIGYVPVADSTPLSAQFSADVSLGGNGSLSVHTLQVDASKTLTLNGGTLTLNKIDLMPHATTPATILVGGDVALNPLSNAAAVIAKGPGVINGGFIDLGGANRVFTIGDGSAATDLTISIPFLNGGVTKAGPGTLHMTANSVYQGDTAVQQGALSINIPFLYNTADLHLSTGSLLNLNFGGSDVIDSLFIDGAAQAIGTWGAIGSAAQFTSPLITGTGLLQVTSTIIAPTIPGDFDGDGDVDGTDLAQWQDDYDANGESDADEDGDSDGRDFLIWQQNFTGPGPLTASAVAVPEPAAIALLLISLLAVSGIRRRW